MTCRQEIDVYYRGHSAYMELDGAVTETLEKAGFIQLVSVTKVDGIVMTYVRTTRDCEES